MAGVAGALAAELLGQGDWYEAPKWVSTPSQQCCCLCTPIECPLHLHAFEPSTGLHYMCLLSCSET